MFSFLFASIASGFAALSYSEFGANGRCSQLFLKKMYLDLSLSRCPPRAWCQFSLTKPHTLSFFFAVPVSGSAYSYAMLSVGEFPAWLLGFNLILEYTIGGAAIARGWSGYLVAIFEAFGAEYPKVSNEDSRRKLKEKI